MTLPTGQLRRTAPKKNPNVEEVEHIAGLEDPRLEDGTTPASEEELADPAVKKRYFMCVTTMKCQVAYRECNEATFELIRLNMNQTVRNWKCTFQLTIDPKTKIVTNCRGKLRPWARGEPSDNPDLEAHRNIVLQQNPDGAFEVVHTPPRVAAADVDAIVDAANEVARDNQNAVRPGGLFGRHSIVRVINEAGANFVHVDPMRR